MLEIIFNGDGMMAFMLFLLIPVVLIEIYDSICKLVERRKMKKFLKDYENFYFYNRH